MMCFGVLKYVVLWWGLLITVITNECVDSNENAQQGTVHVCWQGTRSHSTPWRLTNQMYSSYLIVYNTICGHWLLNMKNKWF